MRNGFYGLRVTSLMGMFKALLREPRAEGATRLRPVDLGRLLGLDRAPEVKTPRLKLTELAEHGEGGGQLQAALGRHHLQTRPAAVGFLSLDWAHQGVLRDPAAAQDPHRPDADRGPGKRGDLGRRQRGRPGHGAHRSTIPVVGR